MFNDLEYGLTKKQKRKYIKKNCLYGLFELAMVGVSVTVVAESHLRHASFNDPNIEVSCYVWVCIYMTLYLFYFFRRLLLICQWIVMDDPRIRQAKINCVTFTFVTTFEMIWFCYGNYEIYGSTLRDFNNKNLWKWMIFILAYGYIQMLIYLGSVCAAGVLLYTLYSEGYFNVDKTEQYTEKLESKSTNEIKFDPNVVN